MNISLNWLKQYVEIPDDLQELEYILTNLGLEVENIDNRRDVFKGIVVGIVESCEKHPNADKLSLCRVNDGVQTFDVVCGAPNVRAGQKVLFARIGTRLPELDIVIERRFIRGVESSGMICSGAELGINEDHSGIMVLSEDAPVGKQMADYLGYTDVVIEVGITPNRGDALSHIGVARDIAAATGKPLKMPKLFASPDVQTTSLDIEILASDLCPRYSGAIIRGISIGPSPDWLRSALERVGIRSINNIVDVTNYVMFEIGQPMHAFDLSTIAGPKIEVRRSRAGEAFHTLDNVIHTLPEGALLICDAVKPIALAGIMGGLNSEIKDSTTDILLESAFFNSSSVRRTSKLLAISSESSYRFERGTDPNRTVWALQRSVDLILDVAGGTFAGIKDMCPSGIPKREIFLRYDRVGSILGISIDHNIQKSILEALHISCEEKEEGLLCAIPTFRNDLEREIDLIEEIARINGYDKIPVPMKIEIFSEEQYDDEEFVSNLRSIALSLGFDEVITPSLVQRLHAELLGKETAVEVLNPVSSERPCLRPSIVPPLLEVVDYNIRNGIDFLRVFEIGSIFQKLKPESDNLLAPYNENVSIVFALTGFAQEREWYGTERFYDIFDLKGVVNAFLEKLQLDKFAVFSYDRSGSLTADQISVVINGIYAGRIFEASDEILKLFRIDQKVYFAEFNISALAPSVLKEQKYLPVSKYPLVKRDIAVLLDTSVSAGDLEQTVRSSKTKFLTGMRIIDIYQHESLGKNNKSIAISLSFQSAEKTLTENEINSDISEIIKSLQLEHDAQLRK